MDADDRERPTDTGIQSRILKFLCKIPLLSYVGNYYLNVRNGDMNEQGIQKYLQQLGDTTSTKNYLDRVKIHIKNR